MVAIQGIAGGGVAYGCSSSQASNSTMAVRISTLV